MLKSLTVSNYAIIDNLEINFSEGFNIITGETGAGKSILIGALGLIMGNRADTKVLFDLGRKCVVEAEFDIAAYKLQDLFAQNDLEYDHDLIIRREILPNSKSRAFVNDTPANLKLIRDLSSQLVDMHQQFDTLGLNNPDVQMNLLDAYAGNESHVHQYSEQFFAFQNKKALLNKLIRQKAQAEKDQELLHYHLEEFNELNLEVGQLATWEQELRILENAETIKSTLGKAAFTIYEADPSLVDKLEELNYDISKIANFHPKIEELSERYIGLIEELKAIGEDFDHQADETELDPEKLMELQQKIDLAFQLQAKHKLSSEEEMFEKWEEISEQINSYKRSDNDIQELENDIHSLKKELEKIAGRISQKRRKVAPVLCKKIEEHLDQLSMENAVFKINIEELEELIETGKNAVTFLFSANLGGRLQEISEVASGGELSRLSLCIKSELAKSIQLPTLIFDEIDSGVSGAISMKMGKMIKSLTKSHQIINITHSPQIASKADRHYRIYKEDSDKRSFTKMEILEGDAKIQEIAKMLSGDPPSPEAIQNAKALMLH